MIFSACSRIFSALFFIGLLTAWVFSVSYPANSPANAFKSLFAIKLDSTIPKLLQAHDVPGLAVGVIERGRISFTRGYGMADHDAKRQMTEDTVLNFASISKPVTAWGMMHLLETRKLSLDSPVGPLLRRWALPKSEFDNNGVTVRRLLSHTAGISVPSVPWFPADSTIPTLEQVLSGVAGDKGLVRVEKQPGVVWSYSGGGYTIIQVSLTQGNGMIVITNSDKGAPVLQEVIRLWGEHYKVDLQPIY